MVEKVGNSGGSVQQKESGGASSSVSGRNSAGISLTKADKAAGMTNDMVTQNNLKFFNSMAWKNNKKS